MSDDVYFYGGHPFSNYYSSNIIIDGIFYPTVEHYYQAQKATNLEDFELIRQQTTPGNAKRVGRNVRLREDWENVKYEIMLNGLRAKFSIPQFRRILLDTGDGQIYEDSPVDFEWGYRNGGKNLLGKALMQIREEIRK